MHYSACYNPDMDQNDECIYSVINPKYCIYWISIKGSLFPDHHYIIITIITSTTTTTSSYKQQPHHPLWYKKPKMGRVVRAHDGFRGQRWMLIKVRHGGGPCLSGTRQHPQAISAVRRWKEHCSEIHHVPPTNGALIERSCCTLSKIMWMIWDF